MNESQEVVTIDDFIDRPLILPRATAVDLGGKSPTLASMVLLPNLFLSLSLFFFSFKTFYHQDRMEILDSMSF